MSNATFSRRSHAVEGFLRPRDRLVLARRGAGGPGVRGFPHGAARKWRVFRGSEGRQLIIIREKRAGPRNKSVITVSDGQMVCFSFQTFGADQLICNKKNSCVPRA